MNYSETVTFSGAGTFYSSEYVLNGPVMTGQFLLVSTAITEFAIQARMTGASVSDFPFVDLPNASNWALANNPILLDVSAQRPDECPASGSAFFRFNFAAIYSVRYRFLAVGAGSAKVAFNVSDVFGDLTVEMNEMRG